MQPCGSSSFDDSSPTASQGSCDSSTIVYHPTEAELEEEVATLLHEQEKASIPTQEYVQQLYTGDHPAATQRSSLIDWMVEVSNGLQLSNDTTFLGVQLFDKYLQSVLHGGISAAAVFSQLSQLHLTAITALWVAAKYEGAHVPSASSFVQHLPCSMASSYNVKQLLAAEHVLLTALDHRLACPTPKSFLRRCMSTLHEAGTLDRDVYFTAGYLAELSLLDAGMLCYKPSEVAASAYAYSLAVTGNTCSAAHLKQHTGYDLALIKPCMQRLGRVHAAACNTSRPCMRSLKYLAEDLGQVAALSPTGLDCLMVHGKSCKRASDRCSSSGANNQVME
eukprot:GHUV01016237.1.p1 GENE.GHUV01016237.1~~GHUV01016237.1.p1  ORF type:complete len:335 (+),score=101.71 GHUV01016237.1:941-1945(+)